jgi:hypothetical protein
VPRIFDAGQNAYGVIAIGQFATGFLAIGQVATGVIAVGQVARGCFAVGMGSFGIVSIGMGSIGLLNSFALGGVGGYKARGLAVFELIPKLTRRRVLPRTCSAGEVWSSGEPGWVRATLVRDPNGNAALFDDNRPLGIKMAPALRSVAEKALANGSCDVLAYTARSGEVLVSERLMEASTPTIVERLAYAAWAPRFIVLALLATLYWMFVGLPLVRVLDALD